MVRQVQDCEASGTSRYRHLIRVTVASGVQPLWVLQKNSTNFSGVMSGKPSAWTSSWIASRYYGRFNKSRKDRWVFGNRISGVYLHRFAWTKIVRHVMVTGWASPDDPALVQYWTERRRKRQPPPLAPSTMLRIKAQHGRCLYLLFADHEPQSPSQWEQWFTTIRTAIKRQLIVAGTNGQPNEYYRLIHAHCQRRQPADTSTGTNSFGKASTPQRPARAGCGEISHGRF
jgi:hypothetical protein